VVLLRKKNSPESAVATTPATILAAETVTVGRLDSEDHLILAGRFEGQLRCSRSVRLLAGAHVEGDILAAEIFIQGKVNGNLMGRERIEILTGGDVNGDVCAPKVVVQEGVVLNAQVRMLGPDHHLKDYLLPVLLHIAEEADTQALEGLLYATEEFLEKVGFAMELRPRPMPTMRPIFRSRQPMSYAQFCTRMRQIESALLDANGTRGSLMSDNATPEQATTQAQDLLQALQLVESSIVVVGPVVVRHQQDAQDDTAPEISLRPKSLPSQSTETSLKPGDLLLELQKIHLEVLGEATAATKLPESH
jgi:cytoskeletal protein CcmA (bactofilin family)